MPNIMGLGGFGQTFLDSYKTMHGMDIEDQMVDVRRKAALIEELKMQAAMQEQARKRQQEQNERDAMGHILEKSQGIGPYDLPAKLPEIYRSYKDPFAAAQAGEMLFKGTGGAPPWDIRYGRDTRNEFSVVSDLFRRGIVSPQVVADEAIRLNINPAQLKNIIPDVTAQEAVLEDYYKKANAPTAEAAGLRTVPGRPVLPGMPAPAQGQPGAMIPTNKPAGPILAAQRGEVAEAEGLGGVIGKGNALQLTSPITNRTYGQDQATQLGLEAENKETQLDKAHKALQNAMLGLDRQLKQAQLETDSLRRSQIASDIIQKLSMSKIYLQILPDNDPMKEVFIRIFEQATELAKQGTAPRPVLQLNPGVTPGVVPGAQLAPTRPKVLGITPIQPRRP